MNSDQEIFSKLKWKKSTRSQVRNVLAILFSTIRVDVAFNILSRYYNCSWLSCEMFVSLWLVLSIHNLVFSFGTRAPCAVKDIIFPSWPFVPQTVHACSLRRKKQKLCSGYSKMGQHHVTFQWQPYFDKYVYPNFNFYIQGKGTLWFLSLKSIQSCMFFKECPGHASS